MRDVMRGQYGAGMVNGKNVVAYREAPDVSRGSTTETFVALRLMIDNWRWAGVPFYLRTGKALVARRTEIAIKFKEAPFTPFRETPIDTLGENFAVLRIQPDEGIALQFNAKIPGPQLALGGVQMDFQYKDYFDAAPSTGYETLLYDCMIGDMTIVPAGRRDRDRLAHRPAHSRRLAGSAGARPCYLSGGRRRSAQRRRSHGPRRPALAAHRSGAEPPMKINARICMATAAQIERHVLPDPGAAARAVAEWLLERALAVEGNPALCLAGGNTPRLVYEILADPPLRDRFPWARVHWFFGDERVVSQDNARSNYHMVRAALFDRVPIPPENIHPVPTQVRQRCRGCGGL